MNKALMLTPDFQRSKSTIQGLTEGNLKIGHSDATYSNPLFIYNKITGGEREKQQFPAQRPDDVTYKFLVFTGNSISSS